MADPIGKENSRMDLGIQPTNNDTLSTGNAQLDDNFRRAIEENMVRYVFPPLMPIGSTKVTGGDLPSCQISAIEPFEQKDLLWKFGGAAPTRIEGELKNIGVYLCPPGPILADLISQHKQYGLVEITSLKGMPSAQFKALQINERIFGTGRDKRRKAKEILEQLAKFNETTDAKLREFIGELTRAVEDTVTWCHRWIDIRHRNMDDPKNDEAKKYSTLDLRVLEFADILSRDQRMEGIAAGQSAAINAVPEILARMDQRSRENEERLAKIFEGMTGAFQQLANNQAKPAADSEAPAETVGSTSAPKVPTPRKNG